MDLKLPSRAKEFVAMVRAVDTDKPKAADVEALQHYFVQHPDIAEAMGNLATLAESNLISRSFPGQVMRLAIIEKLGLMRAGMDYDKAGTVERSLIEHVVMCWLRLHDCELRYHMVMGDEPSIRLAAFWERKLSANQQRYLKAVETLERVRRLQRPNESPVLAMMLKQQINMG